MAASGVTTLRTLIDAMNRNEIYKGMLSEVDKLLKIYFTFQVTSTTAEPAFSSLCQIKTFLRGTMTHCRLNNLFLLYAHTDVTDMLDLSYIAKEFVSVNSRRIILERFEFLYCMYVNKLNVNVSFLLIILLKYIAIIIIIIVVH